MNCKPGDLAYIVWSNVPENVGRVVEVICLDPFASSILGEPTWIAKTKSPTRNEGGWLTVEGRCRDAQLRPISGIPVCDEAPIAVDMHEAFEIVTGMRSKEWA